MEIKSIKGLTYRSTLGAKLSFWGDESFTLVFYLNSFTINATYSRFSGKN
jgi:TonB-dependent starch-binding outer membrane protein SusC